MQSRILWWRHRNRRGRIYDQRCQCLFQFEGRRNGGILGKLEKKIVWQIQYKIWGWKILWQIHIKKIFPDRGKIFWQIHIKKNVSGWRKIFVTNSRYFFTFSFWKFLFFEKYCKSIFTFISSYFHCIIHQKVMQSLYK